MFSHPVGSFLLLHLSGKWKLFSHFELLNVFSPCQFFFYPPPQWQKGILFTFRTIGWFLTIESSFMHFHYHHNGFFHGSSNSVKNGNSFKIWNNWRVCSSFKNCSKFFSHLEQWKGFSPLWVHLWTFMEQWKMQIFLTFRIIECFLTLSLRGKSSFVNAVGNIGNSW